MSITSKTRELAGRELAAWRGLLRTHALVVKRLDADLEAAHGLPLTQFEVLLVLDRADGRRMRMCDIAESVVLSRSGLTRLVDRLEREGLVRRVSCEHDARGAFALLTDAGRRRLDEARPTHADGVHAHLLSHLSDDELELLAGVWRRLVAET